VRDEREVVYGLRAGLAVLAVRPDDVLQVACSPRSGAEAMAALRDAEERGIPCAELPDRDLEQLASSPHHEGLVVTTRGRSWATPRQLTEVLVANRGVAVALDRVRNPYNIGAILRTAAFFGVDAVILGAMAPSPDLASNAVRVAEGGAERVILCRTPDLGETLSRMKTRGIRVVGADAHAKEDALSFRFPRPSVLVMGHEREGMTGRVAAQCDALVRIAGSGAIESLNVSVAAGVLIGQLARG
jgi:tRNA G18 (ribose-2'-O)-methylase SpoU